MAVCIFLHRVLSSAWACLDNWSNRPLSASKIGLTWLACPQLFPLSSAPCSGATVWWTLSRIDTSYCFCYRMAYEILYIFGTCVLRHWKLMGWDWGPHYHHQPFQYVNQAVCVSLYAPSLSQILLIDLAQMQCVKVLLAKHILRTIANLNRFHIHVFGQIKTTVKKELVLAWDSYYYFYGVA